MHLVMYSSTTCEPCKRIEPNVKQWCQELSIIFNVIYVDKTKVDLKTLFKLRGSPTFIMMDDNGDELSRHFGAGITKGKVIMMQMYNP
jgi:thiol-disulfide isomerase/thioredoxin